MPVDFRFPDVGEGITEGELVSWKVREGDTVKEHDVLCEIETDKAIVEIPSPHSGTILKLHHKAGGTVKVGETLVTIGEKSEKPVESVSVVGELPREEKILPKRKEVVSIAAQKEILATPAVRKLAKELGVDLSAVRGSGLQGRIAEEDVREAQPAEAKEEVQAGEVEWDTTREARGIKITKKYDMYGYVERVLLKGVRKAVAKNMVKSLYTAPHVTHMDEADMTSLHRHREQEKGFAASQGVHLTYLPFIVKAAVAALKKHPYLNASLDDDAGDCIEKILQHRHCS